MSQGLFRQVSLERLSSPEQLDELFKVTSPRAWFALIAVSCIIISAITWGFLGSIPTKIYGQGILLNGGGVFDVMHNTSGQVTDIRVKPGDVVKKGDVVARIDQPQLVEQINSLRGTLRERVSRKLINSPDYSAVEKQVLQLQQELDYRSQIVSQIDGRVLELMINERSIIQPGTPLINMERQGSTVKMEAISYVPAEQGKAILPGMEVQVSLANVNKEEYGYMLGRVIAVSEYPVTTQSMMLTLGNEKLVALLAGEGAPLEVKIDLITDGNTKSGYKWSSPQGPPMLINSGTLLNSSIITGRDRPINKVIPIFKSILN